MGHIYQHKITKQFYSLEHLIIDIKIANGGANEGIYAIPLKHYNNNNCSPAFIYTKASCKQQGITYNPEKYIEDNFEIVGEIR